MSFDNHYPNRKDRRKRYRDSRRFDRSCRSHGGCPWCESNRLYQYRKELARTRQQLKEYYNGAYPLTLTK